MLQYFKDMLSSRSPVSSKRFCGFIGWILCLAICGWCVLTKQEAPEIIDMLFICSTSLLGIDSITSIWKKSVNKGGK
jgi:hypothetical protein